MIYNRDKRQPLFVLLMILVGVIGLGVVIQNRNRKQEEVILQQGNEVIVILEEKTSTEDLNEIIGSLGVSMSVKEHIDDYVLLQVEKNETAAAIQVLSQHPKVKLAECNGIIETLQISKDIYSDAQWSLHNTGGYLSLQDDKTLYKTSKEDVDMDVMEAWAEYGDAEHTREVVVALLDTGVDYNHPDLQNQLWQNPAEVPDDGIDNDENGYIDDVYGWDFYIIDSSVGHFIKNKDGTYGEDPSDDDNHGTHIAGIIGAEANNMTGIAGVASNVKVRIMVLKVNGGTKGTGSISSAIEAVKYATRMGADICNLSWGTSQKSSALEQVMKESDMLFVAAAGNTGADNEKVAIYPANYGLDNLISVTYINAKGELTKKSNYSQTHVDVAAPGDDIFSTIVGSYGYMSGSSMAAPHVTGIAAMLYTYGDNPYPSNIKEVILSNIKEIDALEGKVHYPGIPSAYMAIKNNEKIQSDNKIPKVTLSTVYRQDKMVVSVQAKDSGKSGIRVVKWFSGKRGLEEFNRGVDGFAVKDNELSVAKAGNYTVYVSDYAGNEYVKTIKVKEDTTKPKIVTSYVVSKNYKTRTISVSVTDTQSGVKRVKYMSGKRKAAEFLPAGAGTDLALTNGKAKFNVKKDGTYTVFASDYRGNLTVSTVEVKTVKATDVKYIHSYKNMHVKETYTLQAFLKPSNTTDQLTYTSSNSKVATVSKKGKIKALKPGYTYVSVKTASGKTAICKIIVKS